MNATAAPRRVGRIRVASALRLTALGALAALLAVTLPAAAGVRAHGVDAASSGPDLPHGTGVVTTPVTPGDLRSGDLVAIPAPATGQLVVRRLVGVEVLGPLATLEIHRAGASSSERWDVTADGRVGLVVRQLPLLGHVLGPLSTSTGRAIALGVPAGGLVLLAFAPRRNRRRVEVDVVDGWTEAV